MTANTYPPATDRLRAPAALAGYEGGRGVVWLRGEHDIFNVSELAATMDQAIALDEGDLVVDLSGVDFMGVITVSVILKAREALRLRSRSLILRSPSAPARRVLELCGFYPSPPAGWDPAP